VGIALTTYRQALDYLFARTTGKSKFGLERTEALLHALGDPHRRLVAFHVAGTNGKGSVCATLEALLRAGGLRVGKYTSPHLVDFRERFIVDGRTVEEEHVVEFIERWTPEVERIGGTFFEATTAMAFDLFARESVDVAIIEAGLGGRLDSTNVVVPLVAGVTSIGIDHVEYLGDTREAIAVEKAGIFKPGIAAAIGEQDARIRALLARLATEHGAVPVRTVTDEMAPRDVEVDATGTRFRITLAGETRTLRTPLAGAHQASNAALALLMLQLAAPSIQTPSTKLESALLQVKLPGRFQRSGKYIFDVAHNPDGTAVLAATLRAVAPVAPVVALFSVLGDKDWRGMLRALVPVVHHVVITTAPTAPTSRLWDPAAVLGFALGGGISAEVVEDFDAALARCDSIGRTVLVTGSFHTVGDAMSRLQVDPLAG
jgi:dihydrofolate synthase / folylpolyglutamate synthase